MESLAKLLDEVLMPYIDRIILLEWGTLKWREEELYTLEIDDLLKANQESLQLLFKTVAQEGKPSHINSKGGEFCWVDAVRLC